MKPKRYVIPLTEEQLKARETMPKTPDGCIVALQYMTDKLALAMEPKWRDWCKTQPRRLWPDFLDTWAEDRKRRKLA